MQLSFLAAAAAVSFTLAASAEAAPPSSGSPLSFFEGRTVSEGTTRVMMKKPYTTRSHGTGRIGADGTLLLVQRVEEEGQPQKQRQWRIQPAGPNRFTGTMSEAVGPVTIDKLGERFRFRFKMKGGLAVEQWLAPAPDWKSAKSTLTVRKLGVVVARGQSAFRRLAE